MHVRPRPQPFALQPMLERLAQEFMPQAQVQGLALRCRPSPAVAVACATLFVVSAVRSLKPLTVVPD